MDPLALNEKLRREVLSMTGEAREKVEAEIRARERFLAGLENEIQITCSCGLTLARSRYWEHQKETKHPRLTRPPASQSKPEPVDRARPYRAFTDTTNPFLVRRDDEE